MYDSIAVILEENKQISSLEQCAMIRLLQKNNSSWQVLEEFNWKLDKDLDSVRIRENIRVMIEDLEDCKVVLSKRMTGLGYHIFDKMGFHIFEVSKLSDDLYDSILEEIKAGAETVALNCISKEPICPNQDGIYYFNLIELQETFPQISSKMALQRFMEKNHFLKFELICSHLPPWMETVIKKRELERSIEKINETSYKVIIW